MKKVTMRRKLINIQLITSSLVLALASTAFIVNDALKFKQNMVSELSTMARVIGLNITSAIVFDDQKEGVKTLISLKSKPDILQGTVFNSKGVMFANYGEESLTNVPLPDFEGSERIEFSSNHALFFSRIYQDGEIV